jgi:hypothetical protein
MERAGDRAKLIRPGGNVSERARAELINEASAQLLRFEGYPGFSEGRQREVMHAMVRVCSTVSELSAMGQELIEACEFYPTAGKVYTLMKARSQSVGEQTQDTYRDPRAPAKCKACDDTGFVRQVDAAGNSEVSFCVCHPARRPTALNKAVKDTNLRVMPKDKSERLK